MRFFLSCTENAPVCTFKTFPCVPSKRLCHKGHGRLERTHENVFNLHTGASLSSLLASLLSRVSLSLLLVSLSFFSSLSVTMTILTRPVGSLCTHSSDLPLKPECKDRDPFPVDLTCSRHAKNNCLGVSCAGLVPLGMKWACICAGNGCCVWWCLVVLVCGSMW